MNDAIKAIVEPGDAPQAEQAADEINRTFGRLVWGLRRKSGMTLEQLALASGVSRAMLSSVERGEKSPTLAVLVRIASGLDVSLSRLMGGDSATTPAAVTRREHRAIFRDQSTGIERHLLSPAHLANGVEVVEHVLPPKTEFAGVFNPGEETDKYVIVRQGILTLEVGDASYVLKPEDSISFHVSSKYRFLNNHDVECRYYLFITHKRREQ